MRPCKECGHPTQLFYLNTGVTLDTYPEMNAYEWKCAHGHSETVYMTHEEARKGRKETEPKEEHSDWTIATRLDA